MLVGWVWGVRQRRRAKDDFQAFDLIWEDEFAIY